jgi:hypothetical protein
MQFAREIIMLRDSARTSSSLQSDSADPRPLIFVSLGLAVVCPGCRRTRYVWAWGGSAGW